MTVDAERTRGEKRRLAGCAGTPGQGPFMAFVLDVEADVVVDAHFQTYGCPASQACGEFVAEWTIGKCAAELDALSVERIAEGVGPMPLGREHIPHLAVSALRAAATSGTKSGGNP